MALIKCPECGKEISSSAEKCPSCGYPIKTKIQTNTVTSKNAKKNKRGCLPTTLIVILAIAFISLIVQNNDSGDPGYTNADVSNGNFDRPETGLTELDQDSDSKESKSSIAQPESENATETVADQNTIDVDISKCHVKYISSEIVSNAAGEECLVIYYEFTNNSSENRAFDYTVSDKVFQDGVELSQSLFHVNDASKDSSAEIQPGKSITVASSFILRDKSEVDLEISPFISFSSKPSAQMKIYLE